MQAPVNPPQRVSAAYVYSVIQNKDELYTAMLRNQYFCPRLKDSIMTI